MRAADTAARRAALLLYSLTPMQREQVLQRLGSVEQAMLGELLRELSALGLPPSIGTGLGDAFEEPNHPDTRTPEQRVAALSPAQVLKALTRCSFIATSCLVRARDWPWRAEVIAAMAIGDREQVTADLLSDEPTLGPAALRVLCQQMLDEVVAVGALGEQPRRLCVFPGRWLSWIR